MIRTHVERGVHAPPEITVNGVKMRSLPAKVVISDDHFASLAQIGAQWLMPRPQARAS